MGKLLVREVENNGDEDEVGMALPRKESNDEVGIALLQMAEEDGEEAGEMDLKEIRMVRNHIRPRAVDKLSPAPAQRTSRRTCTKNSESL